MITKLQFISDVILQLTQGAPSDDLQLEEDQVAQWATYHLNELVRREVATALKTGTAIPPIYIKKESVAPAVDDENNITLPVTAELTEEVLDLPNDGGIIQVVDAEGMLVYKGTLERMFMINSLRFAQARQSNRVYYREGKIIFLEGLYTGDEGEEVVDESNITIFYIPKQNVLTMNDSDELLVSDQLVPILTDTVVQRGKLELYGTQSDIGNDGSDTKQIQYHTAIQNPTKGDTQTEQ